MMYNGRQLFIKNTIFVQNMVISVASQGGALYMAHRSQAEICKSSFKRNVAQWAGGAISHLEGGSLSINDSLFQTLPHTHGPNYFGGEIIHSSGKLILEGVSIYDMDRANGRVSLVIHTGKSMDIKVRSIQVACFQGKDIYQLPYLNSLTFRQRY